MLIKGHNVADRKISLIFNMAGLKFAIKDYQEGGEGIYELLEEESFGSKKDEILPRLIFLRFNSKDSDTGQDVVRMVVLFDASTEAEQYQNPQDRKFQTFGFGIESDEVDYVSDVIDELITEDDEYTFYGSNSEFKFDDELDLSGVQNTYVRLLAKDKCGKEAKKTITEKSPAEIFERWKSEQELKIKEARQVEEIGNQIVDELTEDVLTEVVAEHNELVQLGEQERLAKEKELADQAEEEARQRQLQQLHAATDTDDHKSEVTWAQQAIRRHVEVYSEMSGLTLMLQELIRRFNYELGEDSPVLLTTINVFEKYLGVFLNALKTKDSFLRFIKKRMYGDQPFTIQEVEDSFDARAEKDMRPAADVLFCTLKSQIVVLQTLPGVEEWGRYIRAKYVDKLKQVLASKLHLNVSEWPAYNIDEPEVSIPQFNDDIVGSLLELEEPLCDLIQRYEKHEEYREYISIVGTLHQFIYQALFVFEMEETVNAWPEVFGRIIERELGKFPDVNTDESQFIQFLHHILINLDREAADHLGMQTPLSLAEENAARKQLKTWRATPKSQRHEMQMLQHAVYSFMKGRSPLRTYLQSIKEKQEQEQTRLALVSTGPRKLLLPQEKKMARNHQGFDDRLKKKGKSAVFITIDESTIDGSEYTVSSLKESLERGKKQRVGVVGGVSELYVMYLTSNPEEENPAFIVLHEFEVGKYNAYGFGVNITSDVETLTAFLVSDSHRHDCSIPHTMSNILCDVPYSEEFMVSNLVDLYLDFNPELGGLTPAVVSNLTMGVYVASSAPMLQQARHELHRLRVEKGVLEKSYTGLDLENAELTQRVSELERIVRQQKRQLRDFQTTSVHEAQGGVIALQRKMIEKRKSQIADTELSVNSLLDELHQVVGDNSALEKEMDELKGQLATQRLELDELELSLELERQAAEEATFEAQKLQKVEDENTVYRDRIDELTAQLAKRVVVVVPEKGIDKEMSFADELALHAVQKQEEARHAEARTIETEHELQVTQAFAAKQGVILELSQVISLCHTLSEHFDDLVVMLSDQVMLGINKLGNVKDSDTRSKFHGMNVWRRLVNTDPLVDHSEQDEEAEKLRELSKTFASKAGEKNAQLNACFKLLDAMMSELISDSGDQVSGQAMQQAELIQNLKVLLQLQFKYILEIYPHLVSDVGLRQTEFPSLLLNNLIGRVLGRVREFGGIEGSLAIHLLRLLAVPGGAKPVTQIEEGRKLFNITTAMLSVMEKLANAPCGDERISEIYATQQHQIRQVAHAILVSSPHFGNWCEEQAVLIQHIDLKQADVRTKRISPYVASTANARTIIGTGYMAHTKGGREANARNHDLRSHVDNMSNLLATVGQWVISLLSAEKRDVMSMFGRVVEAIINYSAVYFSLLAKQHHESYVDIDPALAKTIPKDQLPTFFMELQAKKGQRDIARDAVSQSAQDKLYALCSELSAMTTRIFDGEDPLNVLGSICDFLEAKCVQGQEVVAEIDALLERELAGAKDEAAEMQQRDEAKAAAATLIQARFRGHRQKQEYGKQKAAASNIQCLFRAHLKKQGWVENEDGCTLTNSK